MVVRKSSIPYPASLPPPPPPPPEPSTQRSHHHFDASDVPPLPTQSQRSHTTDEFEDMGNPWQDGYIQRPEKTDHIPDLLRSGKPQTPQGDTLQPVPDVLRPGWSGEVTPRSSLDSDRDRSPEREWWDDDEAEDEDKRHKSGEQDTGLHVVNDTRSIAASSMIKRKPVPQSHSPRNEPGQQQTEFGSHNPFKRLSDTYSQAVPDQPEWNSEDKDKSREDHPHPLRSSPSYDQLGRLALTDPVSEKEAVPHPPQGAPPPPPMQPPSALPLLQEPLMPSQRQDDQPNPWSAQQAVQPLPAPSSFVPSNQNASVSTDDLLDRGRHEGPISLGDELKALPNSSIAPGPSAASEVSLLEEDDPRPPKPPRPTRHESDDMYAPPDHPPPSHQVAPVKPPRPAVVTSEHDLAQMREQRNETYQIKHFNWYDMRTNRMRRSSMLTQNKNGPCPLLALVNALILGATENMQASMDEALRTREQVSLGLIIETLMDELLSRAAMVEDLQLPDVDELNRFLMRLRTGMNANPRFVPQPKPAPNLMDADTPTTPTQSQLQTLAGTFEDTQDIKLYGSFRVKLVHGWLPRPGDDSFNAFKRSAQTYEDAQAVQFGEEELEYKLSSGGLTQQEQQLWADITTIKHFFQTYPTQLTGYGLTAVQETLQPGEFAILFRNDHFSTIYKYPRDQRLYTLITDAGYADRDEIIWESLEDINGARSEFFAGDFSSVSHGDTHHAMPHSMTDAANPRRAAAQARSQQQSRLHPPHDTLAPMTPQEQQEQADMDFAFALQMQEEIEQDERRARAQAQQAQRDGPAGRGGVGLGRPTGRRTGTGNIPIPLRGNNSSLGEQRPTIPPRNQNTNRNPAVNRPADADATDAPPAYEEAALRPAYVPPIGSPLHPSSSTDLPADLRGRASTSTSNIHAQGQTTGTTNSGSGIGMGRDPRSRMPGGYGHARRTSAYGENSGAWNAGLQSPDYSAGVGGPTYAFMTPTGTEGRRRPSALGGVGDGGRKEDRECVVM